MAKPFNKFDLTKRERVCGFLEEYKKLCDKWGVCVISEGEEVEAVSHDEPHRFDEYWGVEETTHDRKDYDK